MTLHEKQLPFITIEEDLKNFSPELKKLHPEAKVPLLLHQGEAIYESAIITEYLEDAFPEMPLMPREAQARMEVRRWTYWCNHFFKPEVDRYKYGPARLSEKEVLDATENLRGCLVKLDRALSQTGWLVGNGLTLADIHVFPFVRQLSKATPRHPGFDQNPTLSEWLTKISESESFRKTMEKKS